MNIKIYKQVFMVLIVGVFIAPQIALAAWWNPLSWSVWNIFKPTPQTQQIQKIEIATTTVATSPIATTTKKADAVIKQDKPKDNKDSLSESPKKPVTGSTQSVVQPKVVEQPKTSIITLPNGAVVEMDTGGNIIRYIKQPNAIISPVTSTVQDSQSIPIQTPSCTQDTWSCSDWLMCSSSGSQTRSCSKTFDCPSVVTPSPSTSQSCTPPPPSCQIDTWSCGEWSSCPASGNQVRSCAKTFDCSSVNTPSPVSSQSCTPPAQTQTESLTLSISIVEPIITTNSAQIAWNTNIPSSAKVFLTLDNGSIQVIPSVSGYSTQHVVDVSNLKSDTQYSYAIEAISGTQVKKVTNTIKTKWEDPYSDYVFTNTSPYVGEESQWRIMFSIPTPVNRDIRVKKAVFKVNDADSVKLDAIAVGNGGAVSAGIGPTFGFGLYVRNNILYYPVERIDKNTYIYEAKDGASGISLNWKEFPLFLGLYSYSPDIYNENKTLMANIQVPMSEWVIMDQSNGKQVKTW